MFFTSLFKHNVIAGGPLFSIQVFEDLLIGFPCMCVLVIYLYAMLRLRVLVVAVAAEVSILTHRLPDFMLALFSQLTYMYLPTTYYESKQLTI